MFKEMGMFANLMRNLPRVKEEAERMQKRLGELVVEGDAGAGMVRVKVSGRMEVLSCSISDEAWQSQDREMLEDLIVGATNQALVRAKQAVADESTRLASEMGLPTLPPGSGMPDISQFLGS